MQLTYFALSSWPFLVFNTVSGEKILNSTYIVIRLEICINSLYVVIKRDEKHQHFEAYTII